MIDFPNTPTTGQIFTTSAGSWQWDGTKWVTYGGTVGPTGAPNKLINPFMEIDQAHEGALVTPAGNLQIDGAPVFVNPGTFNMQQVTDAPTGYPNSLQITQATGAAITAGNYCFIVRRVEADDIADSLAGTAGALAWSVAFWFKASVAGTYSAALQNTGSVRSYVWNFTVSAANTWQFFTQTIPGDTGGAWTTKGNGVGCQLNFVGAVGSTYQTASPNTWVTGNVFGTSSNTTGFFTTTNATFQLGPAGLWVAPAPQPLLRTSFQAELARCQRYYEKSYDIGTAVGTITTAGEAQLFAGLSGTTNFAQGGLPVRFAVAKRGVPTITGYSPNTGAAGKLRDGANNVDVTANFGSQAAGGFFWYGVLSAAAPTINNLLHWTADARL